MKEPLYLFSKQKKVWDTLAATLQAAFGIALFLDYDGTLTPIRRAPAAAILGAETRNTLQQLAQRPRLHLAIVTGRSMDDIRRLVSVGKVRFAANHGFHIYDSGKEWIHPQAASYIRTLARLSVQLNDLLTAFPKVLLENKQLTLSIHYRNVEPNRILELQKLVAGAVRSLDSPLRITHGKKVLEVRPQIAWGKGDAVLEMLRTHTTLHPYLPVFIGDDSTDEDVFRVLYRTGITIRVGKSASTRAQYFVHNSDEVLRVLKMIAVMKTRRIGTTA